jgi:hypothetical protein
MDDSLNFIDDRFPFDLSKSLDYNTVIAKQELLKAGYTEVEAERIVTDAKYKYFNKDGTRKQ